MVMAMVEAYPTVPGAKGIDGTSQEAAEAIKPKVAHLRHLSLRALARRVSGTVRECVEDVGLQRESIAPRFSELRALDLVEPSGKRRRNPSGRSASVLRLTAKGKAAARGSF